MSDDDTAAQAAAMLAMSARYVVDGQNYRGLWLVFDLVEPEYNVLGRSAIALSRDRETADRIAKLLNDSEVVE